MRLILLLLMVLLPASVQAGEAPEHAIGQVENDDWLYPTRPSDTLEAIGRRYLQPPAVWVDLVRYNELNDAFDLPAGSIIRIPLKWLRHAPRSAVLTNPEGAVWIHRRGEQRPQPGRAGDLLNVGDRIRVGDGSASVHFEDGSRLDLRQQSDLDFNQLRYYGDSGMVDTRLRLRKGRIRSTVRDRVGPKGRFEIQTREVTTAVRGTVFILDQSDTDTRLEVHDGLVALRRQGDEVSIRVGHGALISSTEGISRKTLPTIEGLSISRPDVAADAPALASWAEDPALVFTRYRIAYRPLAGTGEPFRLLTSGISEANRLIVPETEDGVYQLRLQAVDNQGFHGVPQLYEFRIDSKAPRQFELRLSARSPDRTSL